MTVSVITVFNLISFTIFWFRWKPPSNLNAKVLEILVTLMTMKKNSCAYLRQKNVPKNLPTFKPEVVVLKTQSHKRQSSTAQFMWQHDVTYPCFP